MVGNCESEREGEGERKSDSGVTGLMKNISTADANLKQ